MVEEPVALFWDFARAGLEAFDRTCNRRQRRSQFVRGIVDELALGPPALFTLRDIGHDEEGRVGASGRDPRDIKYALTVLTRNLGLDNAHVSLEEASGKAPERETEPCFRHRAALLKRGGTQHVLGRRARELDAAVSGRR